jgi:transposase InsO family protein
LGVAFKNRGVAEEDFPSAKTFEYQLQKKYSDAFIYYCRYGKEAYNKKYANYIDRDKSNILANSCWVGDHRVLDILLYDPKTGKNFRPWVTAWLDFKTNKIISFEIYNGNPNSDRIFQSFKWGVEQFGRPYDSIYIDNGKDYRALDFAGGRKVDERKTRTLVSFIGIDARFSLPYNAQSKNIERAFKEFINYHESHLPGYTGGHQKLRPADTNERAKKGDLLTLEEFEVQFSRFVFEVYNKKTSQGKELKGRSPDEAFYAEFKQKIAVRAEALRLMCMRSSSTVTIRRNGVKDSQLGKFYWADWMMGYKGTKVYIRRDTKAYQKAWVYSAETDEFLGSAVFSERISGFVENDVERAALREQLARKQKEIKLLERQRKLHHEQRLEHTDLIDALIASNQATEELRKKRGEFQEYDEKPATIYMDTTEMDQNIRKDEAMKRAGNEDIDELLPPAPKTPTEKPIKGIFD